MLIQINPRDILIEETANGRVTNPRGPVRDTTDLQASIREVGILEPLLVRQDGDGRYWLVGGHRRLTAARILKLESVPAVVVELDGHDSIELMLATNVHQSFPPLVLDRDGQVIGGVAKAVADKIAAGRTRESLARLMGERPDVVSAYERLTVAPAEVRKAVSDGRLSITAFARMKHAPAETQREILESANGDDVTVKAVREGLRQQVEEDDAVEQLNGMLISLRQVMTRPLSRREEYLIREIHEATGEYSGT